jgi:putative hydrolase of the HAD superfamily
MGNSRHGPTSTRKTLIRAVTFDVGGTLIHPTPSVGHIYADAAARHGCGDISPRVLNQRFAAAWARLENFSHTYAQWAALVDETFAGITQAPPSETFFPDLYARFARPEAWAVFPDVVPALEQLTRAGLKRAIVSNWDERLRPLLRALDLERWFQTIIVSCETGYCKPAPAIFHAAAEALQTPLSEILHVGDSLAMDGLGARATRMQAAIIQRAENRPIGVGLRDLTVLSRLTDLPSLAARL